MMTCARWLVCLLIFFVSSCQERVSSSTDEVSAKEQNQRNLLLHFQGVWSSDSGRRCYIGVNDLNWVGIACDTGGLLGWSSDKYKLIDVDISNKSVTIESSYPRGGGRVVTLRMVPAGSVDGYYVAIIWDGGEVTNLNVFARRLLEVDADFLNKKIEEAEEMYAAWDAADAEKSRKESGDVVKKYNPSFNCGGNLSATESSICGSENLSALDVALSAAYQKRRALPGEADKQMKWLKTKRDACGSDGDCILQAMKLRIIELGQ